MRVRSNESLDGSEWRVSSLAAAARKEMVQSWISSATVKNIYAETKLCQQVQVFT